MTEKYWLEEDDNVVEDKSVVKDDSMKEKPLPMILVYGEGYITRKTGEKIPFTIHGEG